ncbi:hypothetical protein SXANM310S_00551 [Streptomyces xanthochromogenes]
MRIRPQFADALMAVVLTCVSVVLGKESAQQGWSPLDGRGYALAVLAGLPLAFRVRAPLTVLLWSHLVFVLYVAGGYWPVVATFGPMLSLYTVASLCRPRTAAICAFVMAGAWVYAGVASPRAQMASVVAQALVFPLVLLRFGVLARRSTELARQLRREQAERARQEVAAERGRIARELHDVVAHHMSVISVQAGLAGFVFASDPATARAALSTISGTSAEALEELRRMLQVLREADDQVPGAPMPGLARVGELAERIRAGGVDVTLRTLGPGRHRRRIVMFLAGVTGALLVITSAVLLTDLGGSDDGPRAKPSPSHSASAPVLPAGVKCVAASCTGQDPELMGCTDKLVQTVGSAKVGASVVEVRYSRTCGAAWARLKQVAPGDRVEIGAPAAAGYQVVADAYRDTYTKMLAVQGPAAARACATLKSGKSGCAAGRAGPGPSAAATGGRPGGSGTTTTGQ